MKTIKLRDGGILATRNWVKDQIPEQQESLTFNQKVALENAVSGKLEDVALTGHDGQYAHGWVYGYAWPNGQWTGDFSSIFTIGPYSGTLGTIYISVPKLSISDAVKFINEHLPNDWVDAQEGDDGKHILLTAKNVGRDYNDIPLSGLTGATLVSGSTLEGGEDPSDTGVSASLTVNGNGVTFTGPSEDSIINTGGMSIYVDVEAENNKGKVLTEGDADNLYKKKVQTSSIPTLTTSTVLKDGDVYQYTLDGTAINLSGIVVEPNATAEIWFTCTAETMIDWPTMIWGDGISFATETSQEPTMTDVGHEYHVALRKCLNGVLIGNLACDIVSPTA